MSLEVKIPAVGESITSGLISTWHKNDGDTVAAGDVLLTLETDKVSTEIAADRSGVLRIKVQAGQEVKIGELVALIEEGGAQSAPAAPAEKKQETTAPVAPVVTEAPAPAHTMEAARLHQPKAHSEAAPDEKPADVPAAASPSEEAPKRPSTFAGRAKLPLRHRKPRVRPVREGRSTRKRLSPLRRKIAAQLVMAQHTAALLTTFNEADMSAVMKLRGEMQDAFTKEHGIKLGFMSFFIKAAVSALKAVPSVNGRMDGDDFVQNHYYDIGVAVGTERGLIVPVIRDADQKSFAQIERDLVDYAGKAREGKIKIEDLSGGVFTISNGGIYGSLLSTPI
jgi:2-oxoglutarate dehydrogenase E2 component (dihydrolipoamide succinyltransferase)